MTVNFPAYASSVAPLTAARATHSTLTGASDASGSNAAGSLDSANLYKRMSGWS